MTVETSEKPAKVKLKEFFLRFLTWTFWKEKLAFLKNWKSPFYFVLFTIGLGFLWCFFGLLDNSFSSAFNWDYSHQYLPFAQSYHDTWRHFFATGEFRLYDNVTFLGEDNIGANAYYGLFDPFTIIMVIFPRSFVPQYYALATIAKITLCSVFARMFLKYRGISEGASRFGALAIAFSGYMNFMVGFPTFVSALTYAPLVLYGIEKTIREKKITALSLGLFLIMTSCFLLVVPMCIWGVLYAGWRYFMTIKTRTLRDNLLVIAIGVVGFAAGLLMSAWIFIPSLRLSNMTGRTASIGNAYMNALLDAIKERDFAEAFRLFFLEVGESPGREMMGLLTFFYPTGGFQILPLTIPNESFKYDAWTASIFCYTPFVILFFQAIVHSLVQRKPSHIFAILCCVTLLFTSFAYYFFFGFSGNGYGRWFFVLVPSIVYFGCWGYDQRKSGHRLIPLIGSILAFVGSLLAYFAIFWMLENVKATGDTFVTYYHSTYMMPTEDYASLVRQWYLYYELAMIILESIIIFVGYRKKWLSHAVIIFVAVEAIAMGNTAYFYVGMWSVKNSYMGGETNLATARRIAEVIETKGDAFYRVDFDQARGTDNFQYAVGAPASASFHSLINYDDMDFAYINCMTSTPSVGAKPSYGGQKITSYSWSARYRMQRFGTDFALGYRYLTQMSYPTDALHWIGENVPFGAEEIEEASDNRDAYRVYRIDEEHMPILGHAIDSSKLYYLNKNENGDASDFFGSAFRSNVSVIHRNNVRNSEIFMQGAIVDNDVELPEQFVPKNTSGTSDASLRLEWGRSVLTLSNGLKYEVYTPNSGDYLFPKKGAAYESEGVSYIINHYKSKETLSSSGKTIGAGNDHIMITSSTGDYLCDDEDGAYFLITKRTNQAQREKDKSNFLRQPRVLFFDEDTNLLGYDCSTFGMCAEQDVFTSWHTGYAASCGFFARGKVKYLSLIWPASSSNPQSFIPGDYAITIISATELNALTHQAYVDRLQDVKQIKNGYTFHTDYEEDRIVSLQIGYDAGWGCVAIDENGNRKNLQMLRLNGGLQGFIAPAGVQNYELVYFSPGLDLGIAGGIAGTLLFAGYAVLTFLLDARRIKKEMALTEQ